MNRSKWADEQEILARYEQDMKRADELGLTRLSGTLSAEEFAQRPRGRRETHREISTRLNQIQPYL